MPASRRLRNSRQGDCPRPDQSSPVAGAELPVPLLLFSKTSERRLSNAQPRENIAAQVIFTTIRACHLFPADDRPAKREIHFRRQGVICLETTEENLACETTLDNSTLISVHTRQKHTEQFLALIYTSTREEFGEKESSLTILPSRTMMRGVYRPRLTPERSDMVSSEELEKNVLMDA